MSKNREIIWNDFFFSDFNSGNGEPTNETDALAIQTNSNDFNYITIAGKGIRLIKGGLISHTTNCNYFFNNVIWFQVSNFQNLATLQHSTAQGAQNRPNVQYSAAQTVQNRPNVHYSMIKQEPEFKIVDTIQKLPHLWELKSLNDWKTVQSWIK